MSYACSKGGYQTPTYSAIFPNIFFQHISTDMNCGHYKTIYLHFFSAKSTKLFFAWNRSVITARSRQLGLLESWVSSRRRRWRHIPRHPVLFQLYSSDLIIQVGGLWSKMSPPFGHVSFPRLLSWVDCYVRKTSSPGKVFQYAVCFQSSAIGFPSSWSCFHSSVLSRGWFNAGKVFFFVHGISLALNGSRVG